MAMEKTLDPTTRDIHLVWIFYFTTLCQPACGQSWLQLLVSWSARYFCGFIQDSGQNRLITTFQYSFRINIAMLRINIMLLLGTEGPTEPTPRMLDICFQAARFFWEGGQASEERVVSALVKSL